MVLGHWLFLLSLEELAVFVLLKLAPAVAAGEEDVPVGEDGDSTRSAGYDRCDPVDACKVSTVLAVVCIGRDLVILLVTAELTHCPDSQL